MSRVILPKKMSELDQLQQEFNNLLFVIVDGCSDFAATETRLISIGESLGLAKATVLREIDSALDGAE